MAFLISPFEKGFPKISYQRIDIPVKGYFCIIIMYSGVMLFSSAGKHMYETVLRRRMSVESDSVTFKLGLMNRRGRRTAASNRVWGRIKYANIEAFTPGGRGIFARPPCGLRAPWFKWCCHSSSLRRSPVHQLTLYLCLSDSILCT